MLFFCLTITVVHAQDEVEVYEKLENNKVLIMGKNNLNEAIELTLQLQYKGYMSSDVYPKKVVINGGQELVLTTLTNNPKVLCEYGTSVSYKKVNPTQNKRVTRTTGIQINPVKVNVFTKDDCPRCAFVIEELEKNGVVFLELNTTIAPSNNDLMFEKLKEAGYKENNIQMPVVVNKGEVYYNIKDLKTFVKQFSNK
jgi:glutaredoxin